MVSVVDLFECVLGLSSLLALTLLLEFVGIQSSYMSIEKRC